MKESSVNILMGNQRYRNCVHIFGGRGPVMMKAILIAVLAILPQQFALAEPILLTFAVTGFPEDAPQAVVAGSIMWEAETPYSFIDYITSIDLEIDGHRYLLDEVGHSTPNNSNMIYAFGNGGSLGPVPYSFALMWVPPTMQTIWFGYRGASGDAYFFGYDFLNFNIEVVPEPSTLGLVVGGVLMLAGWRRREEAP